MTIQTLINDLQRAGVRLTPVDGRLRIEAARGALSPALRDLIAQHKTEIIENRERFAYIKTRLSAAKDAADAAAPGRYDWTTDDDEAVSRSLALDEAVYLFVIGDGALEEVETAFRAWMRALAVEPKPETEGTGSVLEI